MLIKFFSSWDTEFESLFKESLILNFFLLGKLLFLIQFTKILKRNSNLSHNFLLCFVQSHHFDSYSQVVSQVFFQTSSLSTTIKKNLLVYFSCFSAQASCSHAKVFLYDFFHILNASSFILIKFKEALED